MNYRIQCKNSVKICELLTLFLAYAKRIYDSAISCQRHDCPLKQIARMGSAVLFVCLAHTHTHGMTFNMTDLV